MHLSQFDQLLRSVGGALNRWFKFEARWAYKFITSFIRSLSYNDKFMRYCFRRCSHFMMNFNPKDSFQQLVLNVNKHFRKLQSAYCHFRTSEMKHEPGNYERCYTVATFSEEEFYDQFQSAVMMAHLSMLIDKYISTCSSSSGGVRCSVANDIIHLLQTVMQYNQDICRWAKGCEPICQLLNGNYAIILLRQKFAPLKTVVFGDIISRHSLFPLTCDLMQQYPSDSNWLNTLWIIFSTQEAEHGEEILQNRKHLRHYYRFRNYYYEMDEQNYTNEFTQGNSPQGEALTNYFDLPTDDCSGQSSNLAENSSFVNSMVPVPFK